MHFDCKSPLHPLIVGASSSSPMLHRNPPNIGNKILLPSNSSHKVLVVESLFWVSVIPSDSQEIVSLRWNWKGIHMTFLRAIFTYLYISYIPLRSVRDTFSIHVLISVLLSSQNLHHWANSTDSSGDMKMWEPGFMKFMIILCHYNITKTKTWYTNWYNWFWWVCFSAYLFEIGKVDSRWLKDLWSNGFDSLDSLQDTGHEGNWIALDIDELVFSLEDVDPIVHIQGHPLPVWWQLETRPHRFLTMKKT